MSSIVRSSFSTQPTERAKKDNSLVLLQIGTVYGYWRVNVKRVSSESSGKEDTLS